MEAGISSERALKCVVVTPERAVLDESVDFVALPMYDGELGVAPGRRPLIGRLGIGELRVRVGGTTKHFFIDGGFAQVRGDVVTVLTSSALTAADIKPDAVREALSAALATPARTPDDAEARGKKQQRARAQIKVARAGRPQLGQDAH